MIHESHPWKRDLLKDADIIERWATKKTGSEYRSMLLEKKVFLSAFVIRKLIENYKATDKTKEYSLQCRMYPACGTSVDIMNRHHIEKHYDFSSERRSSIKIRALANQIVHSLVFMFEISEEEYTAPISGFFVASDWGKDEQLYGVAIDDYLTAMRLFGNDWPVESHYVRTQDGLVISQR